MPSASIPGSPTPRHAGIDDTRPDADALQLVVEPARPEDVPSIAAIRTAAAEQLTVRFGEGPWSVPVSTDIVRHELQTPLVLVARLHGAPVATLRLQRRAPWRWHGVPFTEVAQALYLVNMAVDPEVQRLGVGRRCLEAAAELARDWPADVIRLEAHDTPAGAGEFYARCGFSRVWRGRARGAAVQYLERLNQTR